MIRALLFIWELPQHILALILILVYGGIKKVEVYKNALIIRTNKEYNHRKCLAVSLGFFILANTRYDIDCQVIKHEYGHSMQSVLLGWLYLPIVGFCSYGNNFFWRRTWYGKKDYYDLFPEAWADRWGGVEKNTK